MLAALALALPLAALNPEAAWDYAQASNTQAMVVSEKGRIVFERYSNGANASSRLPMASGSKSFQGVLFAALVEDGMLKWDTKVSEFLPEWKDGSAREQVTLSQVLSLTSGLPSPPSGTRGVWQDAVDAQLRAAPGERFIYGSYPYWLFGSVVEKAVPSKPYEQLLKERVLDPLGISVRWGMLADGNPQTAGAGRITARDWIVFGEFVRNRGVHNGRTVVSWTSLEKLFKGSSANPSYGITWWLEGSDDAAMGFRQRRRTTGEKSPFVMAAGLGKQRLYVSEQLGLTVVRMGPLNSGRQFDDERFLTLLLGR